jgi:hypothetical protein
VSQRVRWRLNVRLVKKTAAEATAYRGPRQEGRCLSNSRGPSVPVSPLAYRGPPSADVPSNLKCAVQRAGVVFALKTSCGQTA